MAYIFLADGFEESEALLPADILKRAGLDVCLVSITADKLVASSHGFKIMADAVFTEIDLTQAAAFIMPGGMPGAQNLCDFAPLREAIIKQNERGGLLCAICAAPMTLGAAGVLKDKRATCYPGFEKYLDCQVYTERLVEEDGHIITGRGPGAAAEFGFTIAERLTSAECVAQLRQGMIYTPTTYRP